MPRATDAPTPGRPHAVAQALAWGLLALAAAGPARAEPAPRELHQRLDTQAPGHQHDVALTLDACGGEVDQALLDTLVRLNLKATLFVTRRWLDRHADTVAWLRARPQLFQIENHGDQHRPAFVGGRLYGLPGQADAAAVAREVQGGQAAVREATGHTSGWYRGATAAYDDAGLQAIAATGQRVAGFSLNADAGASLPAAAVARRVAATAPGDILIAHMNHPRSGTAAGLAQALPPLQQRGLRFVTLAEAAGVQPWPLVPGRPDGQALPDRSVRSRRPAPQAAASTPAGHPANAHRAAAAASGPR